MKILALDLGIHCGWAITPTESGTWNLTPKRHSGPGMVYVRFRKHIREAIDEAEIELVVYEEVRRHMSTAAAHKFGGFQAILIEECENRELNYESIPVGTIKKHATGKGNAGKQLMVAAAESKWPYIDIVDDNHADALWLLNFAMTEYS